MVSCKTFMQKKQIFTYSLKIIFSGILLFWLYKNGALDFSMLWNCPQPIYLVTAFFVFFLVTVIGNYRWHLLLSSQSRSYSFFFTLKLSLMGLFFNFALPSSVGGDVLKAYYLSRADAHLSKSKAMISVFVDRVLGLLAMLSLAIVSIFWNYDKISANLQLRSIALVISALFVFLCLFTIAAFSKFLSHSRFHKINHLPLGPTFMHVYQSISSFGEKKSLVLRCLILSVVVQSVAVFFFIFVAQALGSNELPWGLFFSFANLIWHCKLNRCFSLCFKF